MLLLRKPESEVIGRFLDRQAEFGFTYEGVGATRGAPPAGYVVDHTRVRLGSGEQDFAAARLALENWQQLQLGWLSAWPAGTPIEAGTAVALVARTFGLWWLNACRVVYVIDRQDLNRRFGFAYGTLPDHAGSGEERFLIQMDDDGTVWYDILAFSRPQRLTARLGYPYLRRVQRRFGSQSAAVMQQFVQSASEVQAAS